MFWEDYRVRRDEEREFIRKSGRSSSTFYSAFPFLSLYPQESRLPVSLIMISQFMKNYIENVQRWDLLPVQRIVERTFLKTKQNTDCTIETTLDKYKYKSPYQLVLNALNLFDFVYEGDYEGFDVEKEDQEEKKEEETKNEKKTSSNEANEQIDRILRFLDAALASSES